MNDEAIEDLKHFISTTISQQTSELQDDFNNLEVKFDSLEAKVDKLDKKMDDLSESVAQAITVSNDETDAQLKDHETRIGVLETKAA